MLGVKVKVSASDSQIRLVRTNVCPNEITLMSLKVNGNRFDLHVKLFVIIRSYEILLFDCEVQHARCEDKSGSIPSSNYTSLEMLLKHTTSFCCYQTATTIILSSQEAFRCYLLLRICCLIGVQ